MDYDTFLLTRVFEFRRSGVDDYNSVLFGLTHTGWIISWAGKCVFCVCVCVCVGVCVFVCLFVCLFVCVCVLN